MRRNSGIIGKLQPITNSSASGIHELFDGFNNSNNWPKTFSIVSVTNSSGSLLENALYSHTVSSENLLNNEILYWKIVHESTTNSDFYGNVVNGTFTQSASTQSGTFSFEHNFIGNPNKTTRTYRFQILRNGYEGTVLFESQSITIQKPTLGNFYFSPTTINEGSATDAYLYFSLSNCGSYRTAQFNLQYSGTASSADFTNTIPTTVNQFPSTLTGQFFTPKADILTEGTETLTVSISYGGYSSWGTASLTISDTSLTPSITITPSANTVTEGQSISFSINDSNSGTGTLYWTINTSGGASAADFSEGLSGTVSITNGAGTLVLNLIPNDGTEAETFTVEIRQNSTSGPILQTSSSVTIQDATVTELYSFSTVTFGSNITGPTGPTLAQVQGAMNGTPDPSTWYSNSSYLSVTSGIILWTVPAAGTYEISARGASGNPASSSNKGALLVTRVTLNTGAKLRILVGQSPTTNGGGGGSFVLKETGSTVDDIYVIAGGGGGKTTGSAGQSGNANANSTVSNGNGGFAVNTSYNGPAGGGFFTSGVISTGSPRGNIGFGFLQGGAGGSLTGGGSGGFGGGGSGGSDTAAGGGGGGGYSGGSGSADGAGGVGAGSYASGNVQTLATNSNSGTGYVVITKI